jgi:hypothetical protein
LESGPLSTPEFATFSKEVVPFLHVTSRVEGRKGEGLFGEYGGTGFPTLMYLDASGKKLADQNDRSVAGFRKTATSLSAMTDLRARIAKGEKGLGPKLLIAELNLGQVDFAEAQKRFKSFKKIKPEAKKKIAALLLDAEVANLINSAGRDREKYMALGKTFAKMVKAGRVPTGNSATQFWSSIMTYAEEKSDAGLYEKAYNFLYEKFGSDERYAEHFKDLAKKLAAMKKAGSGGDA